jgi:hypothetical protein
MKIIASLISALLLLSPLAVQAAGQVDGIKNLTTSTRNYTLTSPSQTIAIPPGQVVIIQDTQFQASQTLQQDVQLGYISEYIIGSPNATQYQYTQPIQIQSSSNSTPALGIQESAGSQPGLSVTQNNAGDIIDAYQSAALEFGLNNTQLTINPNTVLNNALTIGASAAANGILQFGSSTTAQLQYSTTAGAYSANTFGFSQPVSTASYLGYSIGTLPILYQDSTDTNTTLNSGTNGVIYLAQNQVQFAQVNSTYGLQFTSGSFYGNNATVHGNLNVVGNTAFNTLAATALTANAITSGSNSNLAISPSTGNVVTIKNSSGAHTEAQFNDNGTYTLGDGFVTGSASSFAVNNLTASGVTFPSGSFITTTGQNPSVAFKDASSSNYFSVLAANGTPNVQFNDNGSGQLNSAITYDNAGNLTVRTITTTAVTGSSLALTGNISAGDIYASRTSNSGILFLGTNGTHYLYYDGTNYNLPAGGLIVGGNLSANIITGTGNLNLSANSVISLGSATEAISNSQFAFSLPFYNVSSGYSVITNLSNTNLTTTTITSPGNLNITSPNNLIISASQINVQTAGAINVGSSVYGNTVASITGSVTTPTVNTNIVNSTNTLNLYANNGGGLNIQSSDVDLLNSQYLDSGGSSYGPNATIAGNLVVNGTVSGNFVTLHDFNNTAHPNAYVTGGRIKLGSNGQATITVSGSHILTVEMTLQDVGASNDIIPAIISESGNTVIIGAHYSGVPNSQADTAGAGFDVTIYSY